MGSSALMRCIEVGEAHRRILGGDECLVLRAETSEHVAQDLLILEGAADGRHGIGEGLHLLKIVSSHHVLLLEVGQLIAQLHGARTVLGGEHRVQGIPDCTRRLVLGKLPEDVFRHRGQEDAEDQLVLSEPPKVLRVGDLALSITVPSVRSMEGAASVTVTKPKN
jgi:hypothetical protein